MDQKDKLENQSRAAQAALGAAQERITERAGRLLVGKELEEFNRDFADLNDAYMRVLETQDKLRDLKD